MTCIICRIINFDEFYYFEYLFLSSSLKELVLPDQLLKKYSNRVLKHIAESNIYVVESRKSDDVQPVFKGCFLNYSQWEGVWLVENDCTLKKVGGDESQNKTKATFFSFPISEEACAKVLNAESIILKEFCSNFEKKIYLKAYSVYHGTSLRNKQLIINKGFEKNFGMLGNAVYAGSFCKAARFASWGQNYELRKGVILRILLFPSQIINFPRENWVCSCDSCKKNDWGAKIADHLGIWQNLFNCDNCAAFALPTKGEGFRRDGSCKYILRNEEWAFDPNKCLFHITHSAEMDISNILPSQQYDPYEKNYQIK